MYSEASKRAVDKYVRANYDRITLRVRKGEKEIIKNYCDENNLSINAFITDLIYKAIGIE